MVEWRIGGTTSVDLDADLRRSRESMSATLCSSSARYGGAVECRQRYVITASLNPIPCTYHRSSSGYEWFVCFVFTLDSSMKIPLFLVFTAVLLSGENTQL